jgi:hypothetical protein
MLSGAKVKDEIDVRSQADFETPIPHGVRHYPEVRWQEIVNAARLGRALDAAGADQRQSHWRFHRTLALYTAARSISDNLERLHQYCRCIEGLILPDPGDTKKQFRSRTELFIGPKHHVLMGEIYDVRSAAEHLNEHNYLEVFDRQVRLGLLEKEVTAEHIARTCLTRIAGDEKILRHFANVASLMAFWAMKPDERRRIWGEPIDPLGALADYNPEYISDGELGGP